MKNKEDLKKIALERIEVLFREAREQFKKDPKLSDRYVKLARKIAMKVNLKIPKEYKRRYCKHCYSYLVPGVNCRIRNYRNRVIYTCLNCNGYMRFMIKKH